MRRLLFLFLAAACLRASGPTAGPVLTAEEIFLPPTLGEARLSPDGTHLGVVVAGQDDARGILVYDLRTGAVDGLKGASQLDVANFEWLGDKRIIFNVSKDKIYAYGLYTAPINRLSSYLPINSADPTLIVGLPRERPGDVFAWTVLREGDVRSGALVEYDADFDRQEMMRLEHRNYAVRYFTAPRDGPVTGWILDRKGDLALCWTRPAGRARLHRHRADSDSWSDVTLPRATVVMGIDYDPRFLWVVTASSGEGYALRRANLETGALETPVLRDRQYDIGTGTLFFSDVDRRIAGVSYRQATLQSVWFVRRFAVAQATVDQAFPQTANRLVDFDSRESKFLFRATGPVHPASYELLDVDARTVTAPGGDPAPWLKGRPLHPVKALSLTMRDGAQIEAFVALPDSASTTHPVPLVVFAHGGPWVRDTDAFDPMVQFLVSRGYAVLRPNYRGSSGYSFAASHEREFDFMRMHEDVTDATKAMVKTGLVDPTRLAIMGGSFGGYLAMAGAAFDGDLYRCAITECGVFDYGSFIKSKSFGGRPGEYELLKDELGQDPATLDQISPLRHADQIHIPVLIAHGIEDSVVDVAQSESLERALKSRGVPCETFYRAVEGHGFRSYPDQVDYSHAVEAFLARHLGGVSLAPPN